MASTHIGVVLRHIQDLADRNEAEQLPDPQLLERFLRQRDEAAFAVLVQRHGPLVWGVCRRVLGQRADAEDAFQATFLTLVEKADRIRRKEALGSWLYRVAYHIALKTRQNALNHPKPLEPVSERTMADPLEELTARELLTTLEAELDRLPDRYRCPLILCYLQGHTRDEAALQLGLSLATLKRRLEQARARLRSLLTQRGLSLPAVLSVVGLTHSKAQAAVPPLLTTQAVQGAMAALERGPGFLALSARTATLTGSAGPAAGLTKLWGVAALLLTVGLTAAGIGVVASFPAPPRQDQVKAPNPTVHSQEKVAPPRQEAHPQEKTQQTVTGQVLDAQGKPVSEAEVVVVARRKRASQGGDLVSDRFEVVGRGRSGLAGKFRFKGLSLSSAKHWKAFALTRCKGHALALAPLSLDAEQSMVQLHLQKEQVLRGRLIDLQGQPAAGVKVFVSNIGKLSHGNFEGVKFETPPADLKVWPGPGRSDKQGRFEIPGLDLSQDIWLKVNDERFALQVFHRDAARKQDLTWVLAPAQIVEGQVLAEDTQKPLPHARLTVYVGESPYGGGVGISGQADEQGRFRLIPYRGRYVEVTAFAPDGQPYLAWRKRFEWPRGVFRHTIKMTLPRGVLIRGKVSDAVTGKPISGAGVEYRPQADNPHDREDVVSGWQAMSVSRKDGSYQIPVLPGPGHLLFTGPTQDYLRQMVGSRKLFSGKPGGARLYPNAIERLQLGPQTREKTVDVTLRRGVTVRGRLIGPDGKPVQNALLFWRGHVWQLSLSWRFPVKIHDGAFILPGCDPEKTYPVHFLDPTNHWGATIQVSARNRKDSPITVRLGPCGKARARFLDTDGKPVAGLRPSIEMVVTPGCSKYDSKALQKGQLAADADLLANLDRKNYWDGPKTDSKGLCTFPTLIPGATYRIITYSRNQEVVHREFTVKSGKVLTLKDFTVSTSR